MQCGDDESPVRAFKVEEPTLITYADFTDKFNWDGVDRLFHPRDSNPDHFAGVGINPGTGERELHGSLCLGNLRLSGPILMKRGGMLFQQNAMLIHVVSRDPDPASSGSEAE
jgi:hypothetical protein